MGAHTETHCHCGADRRGSDHCHECYCEEFESTCDHESDESTTEADEASSETLTA
jgi:hypothetical protein